jgi:hypothetical protein
MERPDPPDASAPPTGTRPAPWGKVPAWPPQTPTKPKREPRSFAQFSRDVMDISNFITTMILALAVIGFVLYLLYGR